MRLALISDVHANLPALEAVLADIAARGAEGRIYHLGDLVGYSSEPDAVISLLQESGIAGVSGNYDSTVAHGYDHCGCRAESERQEELAHISFEWTCSHIAAASKRWLASLPFRMDLRPAGGHLAGRTVTLVHATPTNNLVYVTEDRSDAFLSKMAASAGLRSGDVICFGHTHKPWHRVVEEIHFINTGSVGRPKDGDWRAGYVLLDVGDEVHVEFARVPYDIERTIAGIRAAGLPEEFVEFLSSGGMAASPPPG